MRLTLLVPGLLWPREILRDTTFDLPLPALSLLLGRGQRLPGRTVDDWLADAFGLSRPLPAAALRLLGEGGEPGDAAWLCLDPVHLRLDERTVVVDDPARLALSPTEDFALRQALQPLLSSLGELAAQAPGRWYLKLSAPATLETVDLPAAIGRPADPALPAGPDGARWRRLLSEVQVLLHMHPVNREREEQGRPTVNALWPWGQGRLPGSACRSRSRLLADDPLLLGLGHLAGWPAETRPPRLETATLPTLVQLDQLVPAAAGHDAVRWRQALAALEADWFGPALTALRRGTWREVELRADGHGRQLALRLGRWDLWRFWRRPRPLAELTP